MLVSEYLSVFTQLYLRKLGQLLYQRSMQPFFRSTRTFMGEGATPILRHGRNAPRWWPPFLWLSIQFGPYCMGQPDPIGALFLQKKISLSITFSSRDTCRKSWSNLRYCSDVCIGATCHTGNEISSGRNDYLFPSFNKTNCDHLIYEPQDTQ